MVLVQTALFNNQKCVLEQKLFFKISRLVINLTSASNMMLVTIVGFWIFFQNNVIGLFISVLI